MTEMCARLWVNVDGADYNQQFTRMHQVSLPLATQAQARPLTASDTMCSVGEVKCSGVSEGGCPSQVTVLQAGNGKKRSGGR